MAHLWTIGHKDFKIKMSGSLWEYHDCEDSQALSGSIVYHATSISCVYGYFFYNGVDMGVSKITYFIYYIITFQK